MKIKNRSFPDFVDWKKKFRFPAKKKKFLKNSKIKIKFESEMENHKVIGQCYKTRNFHGKLVIASIYVLRLGSLINMGQTGPHC